MKENNLFIMQVCIIPGRSIVLQLFEDLDKWTESWNKGFDEDVAYWDLMNAFVTVLYQKLLLKLNSFNTDGEMIA